MAIRDLAGTGALQEALTTTNEHLALVLVELQKTNEDRLADVSAQLRSLNEKVDRLISQGETG